MQKDFLHVLSVEDVVSRLLACPPLACETKRLDALPEGVLAETLLSGEDLPPADRSGMDGYAVQAADLFGASETNPVWLDRIGEIAIDRPPDFTLQSGQCAAIVTGGYLPEGADAVIMVEHTKPFGADVIEMRRSVAPGEYVMQRGEDAKAGHPLLPAGTVLRAQETGLLAALGITEVPVIRRPRVSILSTGDELVAPEATPCPGHIRDVNTLALSAMIRPHAEVTAFGIAPDRLEPLTAALKAALTGDGTPADVVFLSGGSSIGVRDLTLEALQSLGDTEILCHGVALSPGKPLILARCGKTLVWGLPGQVASAQVVMHVLGVPFLRHLAGHSSRPADPAWTTGGVTPSINGFGRRVRPCFHATSPPVRAAKTTFACASTPRRRGHRRPCRFRDFPGCCGPCWTHRASCAFRLALKDWKPERPSTCFCSTVESFPPAHEKGPSEEGPLLYCITIGTDRAGGPPAGI